MRISFYLPRPFLPSEENQIAWREGRNPVLEKKGKIASAQAWIFQTWAFLQRHGFHTDLVHDLPPDGIVISLAGSLPSDFNPPHKLFVAGIVADGLPHPAAHVHIVQNSLHARRLPGSIFMPHWPQPGLIPRDMGRRDTFKRIVFFGDENNLAAELKALQWHRELYNKTGATLEVRGADRWNDYSDADAAVAICNFRGSRRLHKPATKLYNAWLAGVPFVGGMDSAYASDGLAGVNYLAVRSPNEALNAFVALANDSKLRQTLVQEGTRAAQAFTPESTARRWKILLADGLPARAKKKFAQPAWRRCGDAVFRRTVCFMDRIFRD